MVLRGLLWLQVYLAVCVAPLLFAVLGERPPGRSFWVELSVALGFVGLAMLGMQFVITARLRRVAAPYGMDLIIGFHRAMSLVAFAFVLAHPLLLLVVRPAATAGLFNPIAAPWRARFALIALLGLVFLVAGTIWRVRLRLRYETWKVAHGVVAVVVVMTALAHVQLVGHHVASPWKQVLWTVMSLGLMAALLYTRLLRPILLFRRPWEVAEIRDEHGDTYTLSLRPVGHDGIRFEPGQFVWLTVRTTPFSVEEHPFSVSSSAEDEGRLECTIKALGDWTSSVHELPEGSVAYVDGPYGAFTPDRAEGPGYVFVAGGIGITPMMSMLRTFADRGDRRPIYLVYAGSDWDDLAFRDEVSHLRSRLTLEVVYVLEQLPEDLPAGVQVHQGLADAELLGRLLPADGRQRLQYFICGPPPMMDAVERTLERDLGVPLDRINTERFAFA